MAGTNHTEAAAPAATRMPRGAEIPHQVPNRLVEGNGAPNHEETLGNVRDVLSFVSDAVGANSGDPRSAQGCVRVLWMCEEALEHVEKHFAEAREQRGHAGNAH